jgi:hypothetical protein
MPVDYPKTHIGTVYFAVKRRHKQRPLDKSKPQPQTAYGRTAHRELKQHNNARDRIQKTDR